MAYYDTDVATVEYDAEIDAVIGELREFTQGEEFYEYMDTIIEAVEDTGTSRVLADTSQFDAALTQEDQAWSVQDWSPRADEAGVDLLVLVMPEQVVAQMSVDKIVEMADDTIERELFDDLDEARDWLRQH